MRLSIENIFKALEIVDTLSADDFDKFKKHLEVVDGKFAKTTGRGFVGTKIRDLPEDNPRSLRSVGENIPSPPNAPESCSTCSCSSFFGLIPVHLDKCKCRGGK